MTIACYFQPLFGPREAEDRALIELWKTSWERHGWNTKVLGLEDAKRSIHYEGLREVAQKFPTVNDRAYELACFVRHCAFRESRVDLFSDYDLINYGWLFDTSQARWKGAIHSFMNGGPALYRATEEGFEWLFGELRKGTQAEEIKGKPHLSDQTVFIAAQLPATSECPDYPCGEWKTASLVHYGNENIGGFKKAERIKALRDPLI